MKRKILLLVLALTMCFGTSMTANAAMNVKNNMGALTTANTLNNNASPIPKGTLQYEASKFKIKYTQKDLDAIKKIFDANIYAKAYPDVAAAYGNDREKLWNHYVTYGIKEGRTEISSTFNVFAYISAYQDLRNVFGDDLMAYYVHYVNHGMNENRRLITIDAVTKAGITVTGLRGQVIAKPAPINVPGLSSDSVSNSDPEADATPAETPKSSEAPSVKPAPKPEEPDDDPSPAPCAHSEFTYKSNASGHQKVCKECGEKLKAVESHQWQYIHAEGDSSHIPVCTVCEYRGEKTGCESAKTESNATQHWSVCKVCSGKFNQENHKWTEDGTCTVCKAACSHSWTEGKCDTCGKQCSHSWTEGKCTICGKQCSHSWTEGKCDTCGKQCSHENWTEGKCDTCGKQCNHENGAETKRIEGTQYHAPVCIVCGTLNEADKAACEEGTAVPNNDSVHDINCKVCGGFIREESHTYTYTSAGTLSHKGICGVCGNQMDESTCEFDQNGDCAICGNHHTHKWDSSTGVCEDCGATCSHKTYNRETYKCTTCGKDCEHAHISTLNYNDPENHYYECAYCGFKRLEAHNFTVPKYCPTCGKNVNVCSICSSDTVGHCPTNQPRV